MIADAAALLACLIGILGACVLFTNGVEWTGRRLRLGEGAVGSLLAAVGTALPETLIPAVAFVGAALAADGPAAATDAEARRAIGLGAITGAPFMLATLALLVVGLTALLAARRGGRARAVEPDPRVLRRDLSYFLVAYGLAVGLGMVHVFVDRGDGSGPPSRLAAAYDGLKVLLAVGLILAYGVYARATLRAARREVEARETGGDPRGPQSEPGPLHLHRLSAFLSGADIPVGHGQAVMPAPLRAGSHACPTAAAVPATGLCLLQVGLGLGGIILAAHFFVLATAAAAARLGLPPLILALLIAPVATELPEMANSLLWVRRGKDTLALGNISGALVFQVSFPVPLGMLATEWKIDRVAIVSGLIALGSVALQLVWLRRRGRLSPWGLVGSGALYLVFLGYVLARGAAAAPTGS